jgi:hypothetical protein
VPPENSDNHIADQQNRCEFGKTPVSGSECPRPAEVQSDGSLQCVPHAKLRRLEARESTLLDTVFEMDKWLDNPSNRAEQFRWRRLMHERDEAVEQLRFNRTLIEAHKGQDRQR